MYTPVKSGDFNYTAPAAYIEPDGSADWTKLEKGSTSQYVKPDKNTVMYEGYSEYKQGDVVWQNGKLYKAKTNIPDYWDAVPAVYKDYWDLVE